MRDSRSCWYHQMVCECKPVISKARSIRIDKGKTHGRPVVVMSVAVPACTRGPKVYKSFVSTQSLKKRERKKDNQDAPLAHAS